MTVPDFRQPGRDVDGVLDASVLVNFLRVDRMDLLAAHLRGFVVTDHVSEEITESYPDQQKRFIAACREGILDRKSVTTPRAWELFESLVKTRVLGVGECSAIALAECLNSHCLRMTVVLRSMLFPLLRICWYWELRIWSSK